MKFVAFTLLALIAAVAANPINVSDNNIGDIVTVGVNANASLSNEVNMNIISVILALINKQELSVGGQAGAQVEAPKFQITPEMIEKFKGLLNKN